MDASELLKNWAEIDGNDLVRQLQGCVSDQPKKQTRDMSSQTTDLKFECSYDIMQHLKKLCLNPDSDLDHEKVDALMDVTYLSRYSLIIDEFARVRPILELYPALMNKRQLIQEFNRTITVKDIHDLFEKNVEKFSDVIIHMTPALAQKFEDMTEGCEDSLRVKNAAALLLLPDLTDEKIETIMEFEVEKPVVDTPIIMCPVSRANVIKGQPAFEIFAEKTLITKTQDFVEAILLLFSIHYTFNMSYPPAFMVTASVMEALFLELTPQPGDLAEKVNKVCKSLRDAMQSSGEKQ